MVAQVTARVGLQDVEQRGPIVGGKVRMDDADRNRPQVRSASMRAPSGSRALVPWAQPRSASWSGVRVGWREADARRSREYPGRPRRPGSGHDDRRIHRSRDADSGEGLLVGHGG